MSGLLPVAVYGLKVPAGDVMIPALLDFPATFRITMAAIDPSAEPEHTGTSKKGQTARATLKIVYDPASPEDDTSENSDDEEEYLKGLLAGREDDEDDEDEDEDDEDEEDDAEDGEKSEKAKASKARRDAAVKQLLEELKNEDSDAGLDDDEDDELMEIDDAPKVNGVKKTSSKRSAVKANAGDDDEADEDEEDDEDSMDGMEEMVVCTLDPEKHYQQPLDITVPEDQTAYFKVSGTHAVYITGNYVIPLDASHDHDPYDGESEDSEDYDLEPDEDELDDEEESDELDDMEDPRITEVDSADEAEPPKLVKKADAAKKGKGKRPAEDSEEEPVNLDEIMAKSLKPEVSAEGGEQKLSKKQMKKLKKNDGKATEAKPAETKEKEKGDKKVQFAKELEQPATSSPATLVGDSKAATKSEGPKLGVKVVQGVKLDDKKLGKGPAAKKGDKISMRYIGKLSNGKVFDANKKGEPFKFKLGAGEVIKGWDIGVAGMNVGQERRIVVPASLAYGSKKMGDIPANSELTFDLKLLSVN